MSNRVRPAPMLIGHRGAPGYRPEHTEAAYRLACEQGVDAVEPDLVVSQDGVLVIRHENEISGTTDIATRAEFAGRRTTKTVDGVALTGWFAEDFSWAELATLRSKERIPALRPDNTQYDGQEPLLSLADLIDLIDRISAEQGRDIGLVLELKHVHFLTQLGHDIQALLLAELERTGWDQKPDLLTIESFELGALERLRDAGLAATYVFLTERSGAPADEVATLGSDATTYKWYRSDDGLDSLVGRVHGISLSKNDIVRVNALGNAVGVYDIVERAHARGLLVFTWTMRPENKFLAPGLRKGRAPGRWGNWRDEWRLILSTEPDGVFLDHPDLLAALTNEVLLHEGS